MLQALLAALFLFAGAMKFVVPPAMLSGPLHLPVDFMLFIGVAEIAGGIGLILPDVTHIAEGLTPFAAAGLVIIMIGATIVTALSGSVPGAIVPFVVGILLTLVLRTRSGASRMQHA